MASLCHVTRMSAAHLSRCCTCAVTHNCRPQTTAGHHHQRPNTPTLGPHCQSRSCSFAAPAPPHNPSCRPRTTTAHAALCMRAGRRSAVPPLWRASPPHPASPPPSPPLSPAAACCAPPHQQQQHTPAITPPPPPHQCPLTHTPHTTHATATPPNPPKSARGQLLHMNVELHGVELSGALEHLRGREGGKGRGGAGARV